MIEARRPSVVAVHADGSLTIGLEGSSEAGDCTVLLRLPASLDRSKAQVEVVIPDRLRSLSVDGRGFRHAIGSAGHLWTNRNGDWSAMQVGTEEIHGLLCFHDEIFAVGDGGLRLRSDWKEQQNQRYVDGEEHHLWALSGPRNNLWAVGDEGTILLFDGERWGRGAGVPPMDLRAVRVLPSAVWVAGTKGTFWSFANERWTDHSFVEDSTDFHDIGAVGGDAFLAAGDDGLCRLTAEGPRWEPWGETVTTLVPAKGRLYLVGGDILGVHDGKQILQVELGLRIGDEN